MLKCWKDWTSKRERMLLHRNSDSGKPLPPLRELLRPQPPIPWCSRNAYSGAVVESSTSETSATVLQILKPLPQSKSSPTSLLPSNFIHSSTIGQKNKVKENRTQLAMESQRDSFQALRTRKEESTEDHGRAECQQTISGTDLD